MESSDCASVSPVKLTKAQLRDISKQGGTVHLTPAQLKKLSEKGGVEPIGETASPAASVTASASVTPTSSVMSVTGFSPLNTPVSPDASPLEEKDR